MHCSLEVRELRYLATAGLRFSNVTTICMDGTLGVNSLFTFCLPEVLTVGHGQNAFLAQFYQLSTLNLLCHVEFRPYWLHYPTIYTILA